MNKRRPSKGESQLGQITNPLAYKVPGDVVGGLEGMTRLEEHQPRESFCLFLWQHWTLGNDGEILISENTFHKKDRDYSFHEEDMLQSKKAKCNYKALRPDGIPV